MFVLAGCRSAPPRPHARISSEPFERGVASWYGPGFQGRRTASGEVFDTRKMTAAHKSLPFGTWIDVVNVTTGRSVRVRVNDRGPFVPKRILDLSRAAAEAIGMLGAGTAEVEIYIAEGNESVPPVRLYTVQVAAFADLANAEALVAKLIETFPTAAVASDGIWHRVQVDRFPSQEKAEALRDQLLALGYSPLIVSAP